ncbi:nicotinamide N-methyltransferase-like [Eleutherodactylus coqui]|uniref:nicotinamide N-methyltransferase-like n=1 Tax=Eleutherodactylus coqui TaxID=57060 RepID=UPI0034637F53
MDSSCKKFFGVHDADAKTHYEFCFSRHVPYSLFKESTINMMQEIHKAFSTGVVSGKTVLDFCIAPTISHLLVMKDYIEDIIILEVNDSSMKEFEKWMNKDADACDWSHIAEILKQIKGNSDDSEDEEENLRRKIKNISKLDFSKSDPVDSLSLTKADIVTSIWFLDCISKNHDEYRGWLRKLSYVMNVGGYLIVYAATKISYFQVGEHKFHVFYCDEHFIKNVISEEGFVIKHYKKFNRIMCSDKMDHEAVVFIIACKVEEPKNREAA